MAIGATLIELRDQLRSEIGASPSAASGINTQRQFDHLLRRTQERLWADYDWSFAQIERDEPLLAGQRYYTFDADIDFLRIVDAQIKYNNLWHALAYDIRPSDYNAWDSDLGRGSEPTLRWRHHGDNQFEVWPIPVTNNQILRFRAYRKLPALIADSDKAILDDTLIVLFAAAEHLARTKAGDASAKLSQATSHYNRLKGMSLKNDRFIYGGNLGQPERLRMIGGRFTRDDRML